MAAPRWMDVSVLLVVAVAPARQTGDTRHQQIIKAHKKTNRYHNTLRIRSHTDTCLVKLIPACATHHTLIVRMTCQCSSPVRSHCIVPPMFQSSNKCASHTYKQTMLQQLAAHAIARLAAPLVLGCPFTVVGGWELFQQHHAPTRCLSSLFRDWYLRRHAHFLNPC